MLGGAVSDDADVVTVRWYGTSNFEIAVQDRVLLLDTFYDRGPRTRSLGFAPEEVVRADMILIGHPHYDHLGSAAQIAARTGAPVVVHPIGADVLTRDGLDHGLIAAVQGRGDGDVLQLAELEVRVLHGLHADLTEPEQQLCLGALLEARKVWEGDEAPLSAEEEARVAEVQARGISVPEVYTQATMCMIVDVGGYRIVFRDSAGPPSEEERAFFAREPGCDVAIVGYAGRPLVRRQLSEATMPLVELYRPRVLLPCHHDDLYPVLVDMPTEPLKMQVHERLPETLVVQPVYVEPIEISMRGGTVSAGPWSAQLSVRPPR
jgi:L-ascorbate metabolism protein UlaG (beta-lactamase superfamily)